MFFYVVRLRTSTFSIQFQICCSCFNSDSSRVLFSVYMFVQTMPAKRKATKRKTKKAVETGPLLSTAEDDAIDVTDNGQFPY